MNLKEKYRLYRLLCANEKLKTARHPMLDKNRFMKVLIWFMFLYYAAILLLMGVMLPLGMRGAYCDVAAFHVLDGLFPWVLIVDFWVRFVLQETPAQQAKPYTLMPIRRSFLMHIYLIENCLTLGNLFWGFMLIPFGLMTVLPLLGFGGFLSWFVGWWLMFVADGLAYLFVRALCSKHLAWTLLPLVIHGTLVAVMTVPDHNPLDMPCTVFLYDFALGKVSPYLLMAVIIAFLYSINYWLQLRMVHDDVAKKEEVVMKNTTQMNYLNRFGMTGEYIKLETKLRLRNSQARMQTFVMFFLTVLLCGIHYFTPVYDNSFMKSFICLYAYISIGGTSLATIMSVEGNYIDGLMSRRESVYAVLCAKYYFFSAILIVPFMTVLPLIIAGKLSLWMNLGYLFFTVGVAYPSLFVLAIYNKDTLPLNQKATAKQGNMMQQLASLVMIFCPVLIERVGVLVAGEVPTYLFMMALGVVGVCTHRRWLRAIYKRFMQRRYENMEGFRNSRGS